MRWDPVINSIREVFSFSEGAKSVYYNFHKDLIGVSLDANLFW